MSRRDVYPILAKIQELQKFLSDYPHMKPVVAEMVESYRMCRQRSHGDVPPNVLDGPSMQHMYDHVYGPEGCSWCQKRIEKLERHKLSGSAQLIENIIVNIEGGDPKGLLP